ncbi:MAG: hypothetical protein DDT31_01916 [Syntrophomonadaceae bacterium]|nr:hypothetical protein [Bacillota bacterium]
MTKKMTFGEWTGDAIAGNASAKLIRVNAGYFEGECLKRVSKNIDEAILKAHLEGRKLSPIESFAMEVLFAVAGWEGPKEADESYQRYLKS